MVFDVTPEMFESGLPVAVLIARNVDNARTVPELLAYRRAMGQRLAAYWKQRSIATHPVIREYQRIHELVGAAKQQSAPEKLISYVGRNRDFTASGAVVDCYNIVSARTLLSIGAHDLERLTLPVTLRRTTAGDLFVPLGQSEPQQLAGEYGYVDPHGRVICRLDVLQCEHTKVTRESRHIIFFLQGNRLLPATVLLKGAWLLAEMISVFCGGSVELVSFFDVGSTVNRALDKPSIPIEAFRQLNLQTATLLEATPLSSLPALSVVTLQTQSPLQSLVPSAALPEQVSGQTVLVATDLHPLTVADKQFTSYLLTLYTETEVTLPEVATTIAAGRRLS